MIQRIPANLPACANPPGRQALAPPKPDAPACAIIPKLDAAVLSARLDIRRRENRRRVLASRQEATRPQHPLLLASDAGKRR